MLSVTETWKRRGAFIPVNILPCSNGDRFLVIKINPAVGSVIHVVDVASGKEKQILQLRTLFPTLTVWSTDNSLIGFASNRLCGVIEGDKLIYRRQFREPIKKISFGSESFFVLSGSTFYELQLGPFGLRTQPINNVIDYCVAARPVCLKKDAENRVAILDVAREVERCIQLRKGVTSTSRLFLSLCGDVALVSSELIGEPSDLEVISINLALNSEVQRRTFRALRAFGDIRLEFLNPDDLLVLSPHLVLYHLDTGESELIMPEKTVLDFSISPKGEQLAVLAATCDGHSELVLMDIESRGIQKIFKKPVARLRWQSNTSGLFFITSDHHSTHVHRLDLVTEAERSYLKSFRRPTRRLELEGPKQAYIYVYGPRRHFFAQQLSLFHYSLMSFLEVFTSGWTLLTIHRPQNANSLGSWTNEVISDLHHSVEALRSRGIDRIGIVAGSVAALPVLSYLSVTSVTAAALVSAVHSASRLRECGNLSKKFEPVKYVNIRTPMLVVQGIRDEITPSHEASEMFTQIGSVRRSTYTTVNDSHIFIDPSSWELTSRAMETFFSQQMKSDDVAFGRLSNNPRP
jgi:predicted alpha/beta hydrolase family esterase